MSLKKQFFKYAASSIVSMWIFSLYSMVDGIFVSHGVGEMALAGVNVAAPFNQFVFAIGLTFSVGASTIIAACLGRRETEKANQYFNQNLVVLGVCALVISLLVHFNLDAVVRFLGAEGEIYQHTRDYIMVIAPFAIFFMISYNLEVLVKTDGTPQVSVIGVTSCGLMNVLLDYIFVMKFGWGVKGAAFATGLAQVTSTVIFMFYFTIKKRQLQFGRFRPALGIYRRLIPTGAADGITELSTGITAFLFNHVILAVIGANGLVSYTIISYVNTLVIMTMTGLTQGMQPLTSFCYGKGDTAGCRRLLRYGFIAVVAISLVSFFSITAGAPYLVGAFISPGEEALFGYSVHALRRFSFAFLAAGFNILMAGYMVTVEKPSFSLTISLARSLVLNAGCLFTMAALFQGEGIWMAAFVNEGLCLLITGFLSFRFFRQRKNKAAARFPVGQRTPVLDSSAE